jgi:hypothetical protein
MTEEFQKKLNVTTFLQDINNHVCVTILYNPEDYNLNFHHQENVKFCTRLICYSLYIYVLKLCK